jgi:hypothetical protein
MATDKPGVTTLLLQERDREILRDEREKRDADRNIQQLTETIESLRHTNKVLIKLIAMMIVLIIIIISALTGISVSGTIPGIGEIAVEGR